MIAGAAGLMIVLLVLGLYYSLYVLDVSPESNKLRVGHLLADQLHQPGWVIADEMNYFAEEGFDVIHSEYPYGSIEMEHFAAGELDVAYVGVVPFLSARAAGECSRSDGKNYWFTRYWINTRLYARQNNGRL